MATRIFLQTPQSSITRTNHISHKNPTILSYKYLLHRNLIQPIVPWSSGKSSSLSPLCPRINHWYQHHRNLIQPCKSLGKNLFRSFCVGSNQIHPTELDPSLICSDSELKDIHFYILSSTTELYISNLKEQLKLRFHPSINNSDYSENSILILKQLQNSLQVCSELELSQWDICGFTQDNIEAAVSNIRNSIHTRGLRIGEFIKGLSNGCNMHKLCDMDSLFWLCCCTVVYATDEFAHLATAKYYSVTENLSVLDSAKECPDSLCNHDSSTAYIKVNQCVFYLNSSASGSWSPMETLAAIENDSIYPSYESEANRISLRTASERQTQHHVIGDVPQGKRNIIHHFLKELMLPLCQKFCEALRLTGQKAEGLINGCVIPYYLSVVHKFPQTSIPPIVGLWAVSFYIPLCLGVQSVMLLKCANGQDKLGHILAGAALYSMILTVLCHIFTRLPRPLGIGFISITLVLVIKYMIPEIIWEKPLSPTMGTTPPQSSK